MSYGMGMVKAESTMKVGQLASQDPVMAFSSVMASNLIRQASVKPAKRRLGWLKSELNKAYPGVGDAFASKFRELRRRGRQNNQSLFDALRLVLANRIQTHIEKAEGMSGLGGLGSTRSFFCGVMGVGVTGGAIGLGVKNPSSVETVGAAGSSAMLAAGCNTKALSEQARIAEANARAAEANAAAGASVGATQTDNTMKYVAIGGAVLGVGILGVLLLKK